MEIIFARHGESRANTRNVFDNIPPGQPLTERGREQARALGRSLGRKKLHRVFASPLLRARQTAELAAPGMSVETVPALREFSVGRYEGRSYEESRDEFLPLFPAWLLGNEWDKKLGGGESLRDIMARLEPFVRGLEKSCPPKTRVLVVGHGGIFAAALPFLHDNLAPQFTMRHFINNTDTVVSHLENGVLTCRRWCGAEPEGTASPTKKKDLQ